jgi:hypothetical protein
MCSSLRSQIMCSQMSDVFYFFGCLSTISFPQVADPFIRCALRFFLFFFLLPLIPPQVAAAAGCLKETSPAEVEQAARGLASRLFRKRFPKAKVPEMPKMEAEVCDRVPLPSPLLVPLPSPLLVPLPSSLLVPLPLPLLVPLPSSLLVPLPSPLLLPLPVPVLVVDEAP